MVRFAGQRRSRAWPRRHRASRARVVQPALGHRRSRVIGDRSASQGLRWHRLPREPSGAAKEAARIRFVPSGPADIEEDQLCRRLDGNLRMALGGMQPRLQRVERDPPRSITSSPSTTNPVAAVALRGDNFRKIAPERLAGLGPQLDSRPRLKGEIAETVPFRFVLPGTIGVRDGVGRFCFHRRRVQRKPERWFRQAVRGCSNTPSHNPRHVAIIALPRRLIASSSGRSLSQSSVHALLLPRSAGTERIVNRFGSRSAFTVTRSAAWRLSRLAGRAAIAAPRPSPSGHSGDNPERCVHP